MFWLIRLYRSAIMSALTDLQAAVAKLSTDVSTKLTAKDAQIADLTAQLAAVAQPAATAEDLGALTNQVTAIDATVAP